MCVKSPPNETLSEYTGEVGNTLTLTRCPVPHHIALDTPFIGGRACTFCPNYVNHTNDHAAGTVTVTCHGTTH